MSYFKQLYAHIKHSGLRMMKAKCPVCEQWISPIGLAGEYLLFKCPDKKCNNFSLPFRRKARKRGYK